MKKILLVSDEKGWGGWKRAQMIKKHLSDEFNFTLMDSNDYNNYEKASTKDIFNMKDIERFIDSKEYSGRDRNFLDIKAFKKWINRQKTPIKYDLIYFLFHTMLLKKSVKRTLNKNVPVITMVTVYPTIRPGFVKACSGQGKGNYVEAQKLFITQANKCSAVLANNKKSLANLRNIYKGKTFLATRGVDTDVFYPIHDDVPDRPFTVAFCGKANPEKGLKKIIIPACQEADVNLIINERNYTNALSEQEMRQFYNNADAYIVASTMDGTPNTALEAAACGLPIISNHIGNMPEFIDKGENGCLIKLQVDKYVNRLKWMKNNREKVKEMGKKARQTVLDGWQWKQVLKSERSIFRDILGG